MRDKLEPFAIYIAPEMALREARLFKNLSTFLSEGAQDHDRLNELAMENSLILMELREKLFGEAEAV